MLGEEPLDLVEHLVAFLVYAVVRAFVEDKLLRLARMAAHGIVMSDE